MLPVSRIALNSWGAGGPSFWVDTFDLLLTGCTKCVVGLVVPVLLGSPRLQGFSVLAVVAALAELLLERLLVEKAGRSPRRQRIVLFPPIMLSAVASRLWPSLGLVQFWLV